MPLAALTDGLTWWLYLPTAGGSWEQRRFSAIDLREPSATAAAMALDRFLNREASLSGQAQAEAQREFESQERDRQVQAALQGAWQHVLSDPDGLLRDLLAETVRDISGHLPDQETVAAFLSQVAGAESSELRPQVTPRRVDRTTPRPARGPETKRTQTLEDTPALPEPASFKGQRAAAFWLDGRRHAITSWRELLPRVCERLAGDEASAFVASVTGQAGLSYFKSSVPNSRDWVPILDTGLHVYVNITGDVAADRARRVVEVVRGSRTRFHIESESAPAGSSPLSSVEARAPESSTGRRPVGFVLDGASYEVTTWKGVLHKVCVLLAAEPGTNFGEHATHVRGAKRLYFSRRATDLRAPLAISGTDYFVESHFSANDCVRLTRRILVAVRGSDDGFRIELAE